MPQRENITTNLIRANTIETGRILVKGRKPVKRGLTLRQLELRIIRRIRQLQRELRALARAEGRLDGRVSRLRTAVSELRSTQGTIQNELSTLSATVEQIQTELESGITPSPALQSLLESRLDTTVVISTPGGTVSGTVIQVGTDAVLLEESTGDLVLIPFARITSVQ